MWEKKIKKIGVLTSGGDCGGLNAAIRSIFLTAKNSYNMEVHGIKNGTLGLIKRPLDVEKLTYKSFKGFLINQVYIISRQRKKLKQNTEHLKLV